MEKTQYLAIRKEVHPKIKNSRLIFHFFQDAILISGTIFLYPTIAAGNSSWPLLLLAPVVSILMYRSFGIFHEAVHGTACTKNWMNEVAGTLASPMCLLPFEPWKISHLQHHLWSGNIEKDPVMAILVLYPKLNEKLKNIFRLAWRSGLPFLAFAQHCVFWTLSFKNLKSRFSKKIFLSVAYPSLIWISMLALLPTKFLLLALLPGIFLYLIGVEVINFPHHLKLAQYRGETRLHYWEQHEIARSCIYPRWIAQYIVLNFNYHIEHHLYPDAPWYELPKLHQKVYPALATKYNIDEQFRWILRAKRHSLDELLAPPSNHAKGFDFVA